MRLLYFLLVGSMFGGCSSGVTDLTSSQNSSDSVLSQEAFINYRNLIEVTAVKDSNIIYQPVASAFLNSDKAHLDSSGIVLSLNNQKLIRFTDKLNIEDETSNEQYKYLGLETKSELHWIKKQLYDEEKHLLVSKVDGKVTEIWNEPVINASSNYIVSLQNPCFRTFDDCPTGFQIWKVSQGNVSLFLQITLKDYYSENVKWVTDKSFLLDIIPVRDDQGGEQGERGTGKYLVKIL